MDRPRQTRLTDKRHVEKLPKVHGIYYNWFKIYKYANIHYKILVENMFQNYFMISYRRHNFFVPYLYIFLPNHNVIFYETIPVYFLTGKKEPSPTWYKWCKHSPSPLLVQKV